jgi:hypothetical protein
MTATPVPVPDKHGNVHAVEGCTRCACGSKYWEKDRCVDCHARPAASYTLYGGVHVGSLHRPNANPVLQWMRDDDMSDPWGTAMSWAFAVCEYLHHVALADDAIPESLGYVPGPVTPVGVGYEEEGYPEQALVEMAVDTYTLGMAARVLSRYLDWCKAAGRDY